MKSCSNNRKFVALLALGNLEPAQATALQEHLAACDECRRYLNELSTVAATLRAAEIKTAIQPTPSFHQRVVAKVKSGESRTALQTVGELIRSTLLNWRVALPVSGGIALLLGLAVISRPRPQVHLSAPFIEQAASKQNLDGDFRPTVFNYQMAAKQSLEKLDQLLTEQGNRKLPPAPIYTASTFSSAGVSD